MCSLLDANDLPERITVADLRSRLFKGQSFKDHEMEVAVKLVNTLRPFAPQRDGKGHIPHHVLATGPFVYLANQLLVAVGHGDFTRRISPVSSVAKMHSLPLNAKGMYEALCSEEEYHFDVRSSDDKPISDSVVATRSPLTMFSAFFDMTAIHSICSEYGLNFADR